MSKSLPNALLKTGIIFFLIFGFSPAFAEPAFTTDYQPDEEDLTAIIAEADRLELNTSAPIHSIHGNIHHAGRNPTLKQIWLRFEPFERTPEYRRFWRMHCEYDFELEEKTWRCSKDGITELLVLSDPAKMVPAFNSVGTELHILREILDYAILNLFQGKDKVHSMRVTPGGQFLVYFQEKNVQCKHEFLLYWGRNIYESIIRAQMKKKGFYCGPLEELKS